MTYTITEKDGLAEIQMDFSDEGVELSSSRTVVGGADKAESQVKILEIDARNNNMELFPLPEVEVTDMMMEGME